MRFYVYSKGKAVDTWFILTACSSSRVIKMKRRTKKRGKECWSGGKTRGGE